MSWRTDQFAPPSQIVGAVIECAVEPAIEAACVQLNIPLIIANIDIWVDDQKMYSFAPRSESTSSSGRSSATVRLRFRRTFKLNRSLFFAQLRRDVPDSTTGFSGLIIRGEVDTITETPMVKTIAVTIIYNRFNWVDPATL